MIFVLCSGIVLREHPDVGAGGVVGLDAAHHDPAFVDLGLDPFQGRAEIARLLDIFTETTQRLVLLVVTDKQSFRRLDRGARQAKPIDVRWPAARWWFIMAGTRFEPRA